MEKETGGPAATEAEETSAVEISAVEISAAVASESLPKPRPDLPSSRERTSLRGNPCSIPGI